MLQPAWLKAGITSWRKLTGAGRSIPSTLTVVLTSTLPRRATIVAVPLPRGTTCPLAETVGDLGVEARPTRGRGSGRGPSRRRTGRDDQLPGRPAGP